MICGAQQQEKKSQPKKQARTTQHASQSSHTAAAGTSSKKAPTATYQVQNNRNGRSAVAAANNSQRNKKSQNSIAVNQGQKRKPAQNSNAANQKGKKNHNGGRRQTANGTNAGQVNGGNRPHEAKRAAAGANQNAAKGKFANNKPVKPHRFNLPNQPNTAKAPPVKFQQGRRIQGSQNWQGQKYAVFRNYQAQWHDRNWWHNHYHNNIVFVFGAPYYWNAGYWFPAWGYNPNAYYAWDGPIYAYNRMPPDQVIANVQAALQQQGYYRGQVDGLIGPLTRGAIADYQRDHGLYTTSTIDQPTLESLGIA